MTHEQKPESAEFRTREEQLADLSGRCSNFRPIAEAHILEAEARGAAGRDTYQSRVADWMAACFGPEISADRMERNHRFLEEAIELVQATGCTRSEAHQLVDYVYGRPVGDPVQEVGGVMVTLAALCSAHAIKLKYAAEAELARVWTKVEKIRAKQAAKAKHSPLPEHVAEQRRKDAEGIEEAKDEGANFVLTSLAVLFGKDGFEIRDGSETWEGDVHATLEGILGTVGLIDEEGDIRNVTALEARVKELEAVLRNVRDAIEKSDPKVLVCTLWMTWPSETVVDYISAALREGGEHGELA